MGAPPSSVSADLPIPRSGHRSLGYGRGNTSVILPMDRPGSLSLH